MATIPSNLSRVSTAMPANSMLANLHRTHVDLMRTQEELATGKQVNRPSDAPGSVGLIRTMQQVLMAIERDSKTLDRAQTTSSIIDQSLGEVSQLVNRATNIASSQIGIGSDATTRQHEATVIDSLVETMIQVGNTKHQGMYLFGGEATTQPPFVERLGGVEYTGSTEALQRKIGGYAHALNVSGAEAFGALSSRVQGKVDLDVQAADDTRVRDLGGARGQGVEPGAVRVDVDGEQVEVDLTGVERLSDVTARINAALDGAGTLEVTGDGFRLTAAAGESVSIADLGTGRTATDFGMVLAADDGEVVDGDPIHPRMTPSTRLDQLGAAIDWDGGLRITNGSKTEVIDFSDAETVEQVINRVARADIGVRLEINEAGTGFNLINAVSGTELSIGENDGGETAATLGLRSFGEQTRLEDLDHGKGVSRTAGETDIRIEMGDGASEFEVDLSEATTIGEVIAAIEDAAADAGLAGDLEVSLADDGNGLVLRSDLAGAEPFRVRSINGSHAAEGLGIAQYTAGDTIEGDDTGTIRTESVLTHLMQLRDALLADDEQQITQAGESLEADVSTVAGIRAREGARAERIANELNRMEDRKIQTQSMLSDLEDTDFAEAVTRFTQLQQQLQVTLQSGHLLMSTTLFDFLR